MLDHLARENPTQQVVGEPVQVLEQIGLLHVEALASSPRRRSSLGSPTRPAVPPQLPAPPKRLAARSASAVARALRPCAGHAFPPPWHGGRSRTGRRSA